ncbi:MAG: anti-sigma factor [Burkholderiaceae bacterium]|nr:anti-sigma factor [Burkholderiaceae bacterium]
MNYDRTELLDRLAAEYVLGTLHGGARRRFEQIAARLPAARVAIDRWERRIAPLAQPVPPLAPPARVWAAIEARTAPRVAAKKESPGWLAWLKPALGFALGAVFTVALVQMQPGLLVSLDQLAQKEQALPQSYVGLLTDAQHQPTLLVSSTRHGTLATVKFLRSVTVPAGRVIQVWALPKEGAPIPLGTVAPAQPPGSSTFELPGTSEKLLSTVPKLAVSFEPAPVTDPLPAGAPAPEFVLSGFCVKLW